MGPILIIGAKSDIAKALAHEYAKHGYDLYLAARDSAALATDRIDIDIRHKVGVETFELDITAYDSHLSFYESLSPKPAGVISVVGYLGDQKSAETDFHEAEKIIATNFTGCVSLLNIVASDMERRGEGFIIGISSVAGDRGRKSNYVYGSAKAAFSEYLSGLRNRLANSGVHVLTVKPGFVNTKMTHDLDLPKKLTAEPKEVAADIYKAQQKKRNILYTKWFWRLIMLIIRHIPEPIFKKMNL